MSKLQELIQELCPDGVGYRKLGEVCEIKRGVRITKAQVLQEGEGKYPVISGGMNPLGYLNEFNRNENTITIAKYGSAGFVNWQKEKFWANDVCYSLFPQKILDNRFLYYVLCNSQDYLYQLVNRDAIPYHLPQIHIEKLCIPVPPLVVQEEIVRILDHFTNLAAELQAELQARKKQYEYYKQTIFKSVSIHYKDFLLKEIATFSQGIQVDPNLQYDTMESGRIRFLRIVDFVSDNEPYRYIETPSDKYIKSENELIMIRYGASAAGKVFMCYSGAIANNMFKINLKPEILPKYVMYYLSQNSIYRLLNSSGGKSTMPAINFKLVGSIHIPIPPYSEQQRIVSILDKFETLVNDLSQGLPAEIAAVQEQYEYYRNKLFSFPRKSA